MAIPSKKQGRTPSQIFGYNNSDDTWYAIAVDSNGVVSINDSTPVTDTPEYFEDTSFVTGDSPVTLDINAALGRNATTATVINDGAGDFTIALSTDGTSFGNDITIKQRERWIFDDIDIDSIRITWIADSAYRVIAI